MGTRSLVRFFRKGSKRPLVVFYQQFDGYPSSVGYDLANFLKTITLVNGISSVHENIRIANGIECLAAQFCKEFKTKAGGFYITDIKEEDQEWNYNVYVSCDEKDNYDIEIIVTGRKCKTFSNIDKFIEFCEKNGEDDSEDDSEDEDEDDEDDSEEN